MSELDVATAEKLYNIMMQVVEKATVEHKECQAARDRFLHDGDIAIIFDEFAAEMQLLGALWSEFQSNHKLLIQDINNLFTSGDKIFVSIDEIFALLRECRLEEPSVDKLQSTVKASFESLKVVFRTISSHVRAVRSFNTSDDKAKSAALNERTHELAGHVKASQKHLGRISAQRTAYAKVDERVPEITSRAIILKDVIANTTSTFQRLFRDFDDVHNKKVKLVNEANETLEELKALHGWYSMFLQSYKMLSFELPRRLTEQERIKNRISELIATVDAEINAEQEKRHAFFESFGKYLPPALQDSLEEQSALMVPVLSWRPFNQVVEHSRTLPEG